MGLRFLRGNGIRLRRVESAAGDQLHHLLMRHEFLLHERLDVRMFVLENLFDLRLLVVAKIKLMQRET